MLMKMFDTLNYPLLTDYVRICLSNSSRLVAPLFARRPPISSVLGAPPIPLANAAVRATLQAWSCLYRTGNARQRPNIPDLLHYF